MKIACWNARVLFDLPYATEMASQKSLVCKELFLFDLLYYHITNNAFWRWAVNTIRFYICNLLPIGSIKGSTGNWYIHCHYIEFCNYFVSIIARSFGRIMIFLCTTSSKLIHGFDNYISYDFSISPGQNLLVICQFENNSGVYGLADKSLRLTSYFGLCRSPCIGKMAYKCNALIQILSRVRDFACQY